MIDRAEQMGRERGIRDVRRIRTMAEDFDDEAHTYELITIGSAFHWMRREMVAEKAHRLLKPGGILALLGNPTPLMDIRAVKGVGDAINRVQQRWLEPGDRPSIPERLADT